MADDDLYALPPEEFTAARDAAAKQRREQGDRPGAKALSALRRPTVPAHVVNLLVRREPDLVTQLLDLGAALAQAQRDGSGDALRGLGEQRRALVAAVTDRAVALSGRTVPAAVRTEVEATLEAALSDPASADAVRSGRLVRALSYAGFGGADLAGAVAPESPGAAPRDAADEDRADAEQERRRAVTAAEREAHDASGRLDDAVRACERATRAAEQARTRAEQAADALHGAEQALAEAERRRRQAQEQSEQAARRAEQDEQAAEEATAAARAAQDAADAARARLDALRRTG